MTAPRARVRGGAALLAALLLVAPARAHVISDKELVTLRALPPGAARALLAPLLPDADGAVAENHGGWRHLRLQTPALYALAEASARADSATAERVWKSLDLAFAHQQPSGAFEHGRVDEGTGPNDDLAETVDWLGEACRAMVATTNSGLTARFGWRHTLMLPKFERSLRWALAATPAREAAEPNRAGRLLSDARTFLLADGMWHDEAFGRAGQRAIAAALALQHDDGAFADEARVDVVTQAHAVSDLQAVVQYFPAPSLESALTRAAKCLATLATAKPVRGAPALDAAERRFVALTLSLYAQRANDAALAATAAKLRKRALAGK